MSSGAVNGGEENAHGRQVLRFRNYGVQDTESIAHEKLLPAETVPLDAGIVASEERAEDVRVDTFGSSVTDGGVLAGLATKANADLKRDVAPKLEMLEKRTRVAMVDMMNEEQR